MTDKPLNPSVDASETHGSALTPQQAAKACMDVVERACKYVYIDTPLLMEREFTEIISQVTPTDTPDEKAELVVGYELALAAMRAAFTKCGMFPQEIVEPQPKPWWKRWLG